MYTTETKKCNCCLEELLLSSFCSNKNQKDGLASYCRACAREYTLKYRRTLKGLMITTYSYQVNRTLSRDEPTFLQYSKDEFVSWMLSQESLLPLFDAWKASGYEKDLRPSVDRIDDYKGYSLGNIQLMTWRENLDKSYKDIKEGRNNKNSTAVVGVNIKSREVVMFHSLMEAERVTGCDRNVISLCCRGLRNTSLGYTWKYESNDKVRKYGSR